MRFVETLKQPLALALPAMVVAALSGCASMPDPIAAVKQITAPSSDAKSTEANPAQPASAEKAGPAAVTAAPKPAEPEIPVDPRAQAAFDNARRAMRAGRNDEAERQLKALAQSNPELGGVHANLGLLYRQNGKLPEAAAALERAVEVSPQQPVFHNQLGITYRQQ